MNNYQQILTNNQRLLILQALQSAPAHSANEFLIQAYLVENGMGIDMSSLRNQLNWLVDNDLITASELNIKLIQKGLDVANNLLKIDGIAAVGV